MSAKRKTAKRVKQPNRLRAREARRASNAGHPPVRCPDMELAPPRDFDPSILLYRPGESPLVSRAKEFTLLLALAFNDFKSLAWAVEQLMRGKPADEETPDPYRGNWIGTVDFFDRLSSGLIWEVYGILRSYADVIASDLVRRAVGRLQPTFRGYWRRFVADANHPDSQAVREYHGALRNGLAFHYRRAGQPLLAAYGVHFAKDPSSPIRGRAWVSAGRNAEESRFFFADAAAQSAKMLLEGDFGIAHKERSATAQHLNVAIRFVVNELLVELQAAAQPARSAASGPGTLA